MLVLSRKPGESICIGHNIFVDVRQVRGNRVYLGIQAPLDIAIRRSELEPLAAPVNQPDPTMCSRAVQQE